jgi:hypothetical protein
MAAAAGAARHVALQWPVGKDSSTTAAAPPAVITQWSIAQEDCYEDVVPGLITLLLPFLAFLLQVLPAPPSGL